MCAHHHHVGNHLIFGIIMNASFTIIEFIAGLLSNSLALLSDAVHDLSDTIALLISLFATKKAQAAPTERQSFGFHRATILAATLNAVMLVILTLFIFYRAALRIMHPEPIKAIIVFWVAIFGVVFNGIVVLRMWKDKDKDLNLRSAFWHLAEDALGWIGVLIAGVIMIFTGWYIVDPLISILIGLLVLRGAWGVLTEAVNILMEGTPKGIDLCAVKKTIMKHKEIKGVHDLHIWSLGGGYTILSCHICVDDMTLSTVQKIIHNLHIDLFEKHRIRHVTIEPESGLCCDDRRCN